MRLLVNTTSVQFTVGLEAKPKTDQNNVQRTDRATNLPLWTVQLVAVDDSGAEVINVTVAAPQAPKVAAGSPVTPVDLQAIPWAQNGKNGVAFRATEIRTLTAAKGSAAAA